MKTTNVILLGVVGVGAVGAYMYMKNKQAQNALLSGSLPAPATNQGGGFATAPTTNQGGGFATAPATNQGGGFATAPTTNQGGSFATAPATETTNNSVSTSDSNVNLVNATVLLGQRAVLVAQRNAPYLPNSGQYSASDYRQFFEGKASAKRKIIELDKKLASLGYKVNDTGALVKI